MGHEHDKVETLVAASSGAVLEVGSKAPTMPPSFVLILPETFLFRNFFLCLGTPGSGVWYPTSGCSLLPSRTIAHQL